MKTILALLALGFLIGCGSDLNNSNNDNQNNTNSTPVCGNGTQEVGEDCDDGAANSDVLPNACRTDCRSAFCGDGVIDTGEACDSQNLASNSCGGLGFTKGTLACSGTCEYDTSDCSTCGNNLAEGENSGSVGYEVCDGTDLRQQTCLSIGQASGILKCTSLCTWDIAGCTGGGPVCGNGVVEGNEECDDGNNNVHDSCPDGPAGTCMHAYCGDGFVWTGIEGCDDGNGINEDICPDGIGGTCQLATCGDGFLYAATEECDDGTANSATEPDACRLDCKEAHCGDGVKDAGEVCDGSEFGDLVCPGCSADGYLWCGGGCQVVSYSFCELPCDVMTNENCCSDKACYPDYAGPTNKCFTPGTLTVGQACEWHHQCAPTLGCYGYYCVEMCETTADCTSGTCQVADSKGNNACFL
jgi:cysteine-rich repeat protein